MRKAIVRTIYHLFVFSQYLLNGSCHTNAFILTGEQTGAFSRGVHHQQRQLFVQEQKQQQQQQQQHVEEDILEIDQQEATTTATTRRLFPFQKEGAKALISKKRLLLSDAMGLGKTCQAISALNQIGRPDSRILVICPKSVLGVWQSELDIWLKPELASRWNITVATTKDPPELQPGSITLINYDICQKLKKLLQTPIYDVLICDEAHYLKSLDSQRTKAIIGDISTKERSDKNSNHGIQSEYLWLLTGTPVMNRPVELFPLVHAVAPKGFASFDDYVNRYCDPKTKRLLTRGSTKPVFVKDYSGATNLQELSKRLESIMLRRYKLDVLSELPPKFRTCTCLTTADLDINIAEQERVLLKATIQNHMTGKDNDDSSKNNNDRLMDLDDFGAKADDLMKYIDKSLGSDKALLAKISAVRQQTASLKLKPSIELLEEYIQYEKIVVFAHHRAVIDDLMNHFGTKKAVAFMGGMKTEDRAKAIRKFQEDPNIRLFVGSIRAAGVGVTLTAASHVVFLELDWSPAVMTQAEDRCHRVGQADSVRIEYFVFKDTIDEWLSRSLLFKQSKINEILPEKFSSTHEHLGYTFNFGKHSKSEVWQLTAKFLSGYCAFPHLFLCCLCHAEGLRLEDVPRPYVEYLIKKNVYKNRPDLWRALASTGIVSEPPPGKEHNKDVDYVFDFGKYSGKRWDEASEGYREWILKNRVWDSEGRQNLRRALLKAGFDLS